MSRPDAESEEGGEGAPPGAAKPPASMARDAAEITAANVLSRVTGLVRVVAVAGALGTTFLGNTYQTANLVSNVLFELLAAGLLSSVLVPPFVGMLDRGHRDDAERVAGAVLGVALVVLGTVAVVGMVGRTSIMRAMTVAVDDPAVRAEEVRLGSFLLLLFLPQVLLYAVGAVATALLHGARRFRAAALAPVANNVVVVATMAVFWVVRPEDGMSGTTGFDLPASARWVLGAGTTAGVAAMTIVALAGLRRAGLHLRPRWDPRRPELANLARSGAWAAAYLALGQGLVATTLVLANRVEGGVVAYHLAFTVFLLPHAVLAHPTMTAVYPRLAAEAAGRHWRSFADALAGSSATVVFLVAPAAALLVALGRPALSLLRLGSLDMAGTGLAGRVLVAYAVGLVGYAGFQLLTRASYAAGDTRSPALVNSGVALGGSVLMLVLFGAAGANDRVVVLGVAHSVAMMVGAAALLVIVDRRVGGRCLRAASLLRGLPAGAAAGVTARLVADLVPGESRLAALVAVGMGGTAGIVVYLAGQWWMRAPELTLLRARRLAVASPGNGPDPAREGAS